MKTEVFMQRNLAGIPVRQSNQTEMFNVTDLVDGFNEMRRAEGMTEKHLHHYWANDSTKEFLEALEKQTRECTGLLKAPTEKQITDFRGLLKEPTEKQTWEFPSLLKVTKRGKLNKGTWVHPAMFVDIAMWLNPEFKAKTMMWLADNLLVVRNESGKSYNAMTCALVDKFPYKTPRFMIMNFGKKINKYILGDDERDWQQATKEELDAREKLHLKVINACELLPDGIKFDEFCSKVFT